MPVTAKREEELDKILEQFASFDHLEKVEFPELKENETEKK